jgi:uncharacterized membrane protein YeaQ/YmgE (transglycosylase-associated protein family)
MENKENKNLPECCKPKQDSKNKGLVQGIIYGTIPHIGCIAFIILSIVGATFAASLFKPLLAKAYFFYFMILLSFVFATISAFFYLRKQGGIKKAKEHKGYLSILYGTTIIISLIFYFFIFPLLANIPSISANSGQIVSTDANEKISLKVNIPCSGHALLISDEIKKINGIVDVKFSMPNIFDVTFDSSKTTREKILSLDIFKEYPATILANKF